MKEIVKNTIVLLCITLVTGILLGLVYVVTEEPIRVQEEKRKQEAYLAVFEGAETFEVVEGYDAAAMAETIKNNGVEPSIAGITEVAEAKDASGAGLGYVFTVESYKGYGGTIEFMVGIREDGTVNGYSILSIEETVGLGMKAKDAAFKDQFNNKKVDSFAWTKTGASAENEIDAISGATKTTKAMTYGVNAAIGAFKYMEGEE